MPTRKKKQAKLQLGTKNGIVPTAKQKRTELQRVLRNSGFRMGMNEFHAEVDFASLKKRNDAWEAGHQNQSLIDRKTAELLHIVAYVCLRNPVYHIQIHVHAAHKAGASPEEIYEVINRCATWAGGTARQNGMEAWRLVFRPDLPTIFRVSKLTTDSF